MEIARIEDVFVVKNHLVLRAIVLVAGLKTCAEIQSLFSNQVLLQTPSGDLFFAPVSEVNVHQSNGRVTQVMIGIDPPMGQHVPKGTVILST